MNMVARYYMDNMFIYKKFFDLNAHSDVNMTQGIHIAWYQWYPVNLYNYVLRKKQHGEQY